MKRRRVNIRVSDHAVLRWFEREHGIDIEHVRSHLSGIVANGAELGAVAVAIDNVKFVLVQNPTPKTEPQQVVVVTAKHRS